jgi:hypothetical protein
VKRNSARAIGGVVLLCLLSLLIWSTAKPKLILWSWQRNDDLTYIDDNVSVAPLVATIFVNAKGVLVEPRRNVLKINKNITLIPVIRLEIPPHIKVSDDHIETIVRHIRSFVTSSNARCVQIDFDARKSQRPLYEKILTQLHAAMPAIELSITALTSWCVGDVWIDTLPITHAVPMMYNLGKNAHEFKDDFKTKRKWRSKKCNGYIGFECNDMFTKPPRGWHVYVFNNNAWTADDYQKVKDTTG